MGKADHSGGQAGNKNKEERSWAQGCKEEGGEPEGEFHESRGRKILRQDRQAQNIRQEDHVEALDGEARRRGSGKGWSLRKSYRSQETCGCSGCSNKERDEEKEGISKARLETVRSERAIHRGERA